MAELLNLAIQSVARRAGYQALSREHDAWRIGTLDRPVVLLRTGTDWAAGMTTRRLAAIVAADIAGYSRLMHADEDATHARSTHLMTSVIEPAIASHNGRIVKHTGDGFLAEFGSAVEAVKCALRFQADIAAESKADELRVQFRVGVHLGDVIVEPSDIFGDGVNIAARLESLADPGGILVSGAVHDTVRGRLSSDFEDLGEQMLKNIARPVRAYRTVGATAPPRPALALPDRPSPPVLPFQNMSDGPEQSVIRSILKRGYISPGDVSVRRGDNGSEAAGELQNRPHVTVIPFRPATSKDKYFSAALTEEIITALSRFRSTMSVGVAQGVVQGAAVSLTATEKDRAQQNSYVLEGVARRAGVRVRVTLRLTECVTDQVVWAERYENNAEGPFRLQDDVTEAATVAIQDYVLRAETKRVLRADLSRLDARGLLLAALPDVLRQTVLSTSQAVALLRRALVLDAGYAPAVAMLAMCQAQQIRQGWRPSDPDVVTETLAFARQAIAADPSNAMALGIGSFVPTWLVGDHELGAELSAKATAAGRHSVMILAMTGAVSALGGDSQGAIARLETAMRLNPLSPLAPRLHANLASAHLFAGHYDEAARWALRALSVATDNTDSRLYLIVALSLAGNREGVRRAVAEMRTRQLAELPHWPGRMHLRYSWMTDLLEEGLRRANLLAEIGPLLQADWSA